MKVVVKVVVVVENERRDDYKAQEEYYQSEEYLSTLNKEGIGTSYEDMKKILEKGLIKKNKFDN